MTETKMLSRRLTDEIKEISNKTEQKNKEKMAGGGIQYPGAYPNNRKSRKREQKK